VLSPDFVRNVPAATRVDMPALLENVLADGGQVSVFPLHEYWLDIGRMEDFHRAQRDVQRVLNG